MNIDSIIITHLSGITRAPMYLIILNSIVHASPHDRKLVRLAGKRTALFPAEMREELCFEPCGN